MPATSENAEQKRKLELLAAGVVSLGLFALTFAVTKLAPTYESLDETVTVVEPVAAFPDFASISDVDEKKQKFFDFLQGYVHQENELISELRLELLAYAEIVERGVPLSESERNRALDLASSYGVVTEEINDQALVSELLLKVDVIPTSLVLAQAANESAWGTSRFALEGNNIFGQWCFEEGCGIVPNRRIEGATHEVKVFSSIEDSIKGYFLNINSHHLYAGFREDRARLRKLGRSLNSLELVEGLGRYSQRGANYIDEVQTLIQQNQLRQRDRRWLEN